MQACLNIRAESVLCWFSHANIFCIGQAVHEVKPGKTRIRDPMTVSNSGDEELLIYAEVPAIELSLELHTARTFYIVCCLSLCLFVCAHFDGPVFFFCIQLVFAGFQEGAVSRGAHRAANVRDVLDRCSIDLMAPSFVSS